jgi:hypothetical protein
VSRIALENDDLKIVKDRLERLKNREFEDRDSLVDAIYSNIAFVKAAAVRLTRDHDLLYISEFKCAAYIYVDLALDEYSFIAEKCANSEPYAFRATKLQRWIIESLMDIDKDTVGFQRVTMRG